MGACIAVPCATASSGETAQFGSFPKRSASNDRTRDMRDDPPTRTSSSTSEVRMPTRSSTVFTGAIARAKRCDALASYSARVSVRGAAARSAAGSRTVADAPTSPS